MPFHSRQLPEPPDRPSPRPTADGMNPSSALLQDLLREKKAAQHARRMSESQQSAYGRQVQSSPLAPSMANHFDPTNRRTSAYTAPKEMGLREMEEYISKINKQNFDLKLEVFHRRQRNEALEAKAIKAEEVESQNEELRQVNDDLLQELEKRDAAVQEAVTLICDLEARIDQLEKEQSSNGRSSTTPANDTNYASAQSPKPPEPPTTPLPSYGSPRVTSSTPDSKGRHTPGAGRTYKDRQDDLLVRSPTFLRDANPSTSALRGLFVNQDESLTAKGFRLDKPSTRSLRRAGSFLSQDEDPEIPDGDAFSLNPRRLSLLSESSFVSVYGPNKEKITPSTANSGATKVSSTQEQETSFTRKLTPQEGRIRSWIDSKDHPSSSNKRPVQGVKSDTFSSIGTVLGPNQLRPRDTLTSVSPTPSRRQRQDVVPQPLERTSQKPSLVGPTFGPDVLPPTPGTMSTATLGGRSSNQSIVDRRSLNGGQSRPSSSTKSALPETRSYGATNKETTAQNRPQHAMDDTDTDIEISDNERHYAKAEVSANGNYYQSDNQFSGFSQAGPFTSGTSKVNRASSIRTSQRPSSMSPSKDFMFNGEGIDSIRPAQTISRPSPSSSHHSASKAPSKPNARAPASSKGQARNTDKESSTQQDIEPSIEPSIRRSSSTHSKSPHSTAQVLPTPRLTDRLFRRNTSHPAATTQTESPPAYRPETTASPESKIRKPRPSSLYVRSNSTQLPSPSSTPIKVDRATRPGAANHPVAPDPTAWRRNSVAFKAADDNGGFVAHGGVDGQQQQAKRLSVGAFGRSASLRIKEGLRGKK
ncbi:MAG: hypothetical protein LQ343_003464 [Gyalolechia ehrenbergii]|nr:MAG: hypothetical protein LQ343_003464 [Gyalolechia ehrenbergii]